MLSKLTQELREVSNSDEKNEVEAQFAKEFDADFCEIHINKDIYDFSVRLKYFDFDNIGDAQSFIDKKLPQLYDTVKSQSEDFSASYENIKTLQTGIRVKVAFSYDME